MTDRLYYRSAYMKEFDAEVTACTEDKDRYLIRLDRTAFYPEGGGQPADKGKLFIKDDSCGSDTEVSGPAEVFDVHEREGEIFHYCNKSIEPGTRVHGVIDWDRRLDHMQQHSGEHIVSGMICETFHCDNVGFHMGKDIVTIDYNADIGFEELKTVEDRANAYIREDHEFAEHWYKTDELKDIEYRSKKELTGDVRITSFPGADICACCGTHLARSGEVGLVKFLSAVSFSKGTRIELLCGKRAFDFLSMSHDRNAAVAKAMATSVDKTYDVYMKQRAELSEANYRSAELEKLYAAELAKQYAGKDNVLIFNEVLSPNGIRALCAMLSDICGGYTAVFGGSNGDYRYAFAAKDKDIRAWVKLLNTTLNGKGGGSQSFAQGFVKAERQKIQEFFEEKI